ncbi:MAG: hypothetical protein ACWGHO_02360 [Candidatus Moraniibacteriota bacterium]
MKDIAKNLVEDIKEVFKERVFSPMYFYFIIAWVIANWSFVYVLLFTDEGVIINSEKVLKIDYLRNFYNFSTLADIYWSLLELFIVPGIAAFAAAWWLSRLSEKFYKKHEEHKQENRMILRGLEYAEKVRIVKQERNIREAESDKNIIKYENNEAFNESLDESVVDVAGVTMLPSEILYNTDYEAYKQALEEWNNEGIKDKFRDEIILEHKDDLKSQMEYAENRDK